MQLIPTDDEVEEIDDVRFDLLEQKWDSTSNLFDKDSSQQQEELLGT